MPSKSDKQHRMMEAVKHNPKFAKKVGIPQSVGRDYVAASHWLQSHCHNLEIESYRLGQS